MPNTEDFKNEVEHQLSEAGKQGLPYIDLNSGNIHRSLGGYPGRNHRMKSCCAVMRSFMHGSDRIIDQPEKGDGASFTIRFLLPR
jgi:5-methylcytosine-specific restriction protein A